jgi:hypothetical protein
MDNYVLRLRPEAARKLIDALRIKFNSPVRHAGKLYGWDTLIRLKAQELANYILGKRSGFNFDQPGPALDRSDSGAVRNLILSLTKAEARKRGIGKNTLWYLKSRAQSGEPFEIYAKIAMKLEQANSLGEAR